MKYPLNFEKWLKLPSTQKKLALIKKDLMESQQLELFEN